MSSTTERQASLGAGVPLLDAGISKGQDLVASQNTVQDDSSLRTVDELIRSRAKSHPDLPILSYPSEGISYVDYTFQQLDVFAYRVAKHIQGTIPSRKSSSEDRIVVAMLGPSNLEYLVTMLALIKLGHTILFLSTRISAPAINSLVTTTHASYLIADPRYLETSRAAQQSSSSHIEILEMPTRSIFEFPVEVYADTQLDSALDPAVETEKIVYIIHSSGSTGFPKPIYQKQSAALANYMGNMNMRAFITLPLYHNHGICNWFRAVCSRKSICMYNADLPLTNDFLVKIMSTHEFEIFYGVPYALKILADSHEGLAQLARLKVVMYGGSPCPDSLGDRLVENGINLISHYGATEVGQLMTSSRPAGDNAWNYVRESEKLSPFLRWIPHGPGLYECCVLPGWPSKTSTNQEDGSYRTKDLFEPHPTIPRAWKYSARVDDTIVLVNGEKFNPVTTEGAIRSNELVTEAVIFGSQQPYLGVLIVPSPVTAGKSQTEVRELIWPIIEAAQESDDAFAKLSKGMVVILPHDIDYPRTDKGSIIRQAFYKEFAEEISAAYDLSNSNNENAKEMSEGELRDYLSGLVANAVPQAADFDHDTDFFSLGLDSLQAIQIRSSIVQAVKTDKALAQNVVFDHPSISQLSAYILGTTTKTNGVEVSIEDEMRSLVEKYDDFAPLQAGTSVAVTGSTGSLGAHMVSILVKDPTIERVYCLVRARDETAAQRRIIESMTTRKVYHNQSLAARKKIVAIPSDFSKESLGLSEERYREVASGLRAVIHSAWAVNFNLKLSSFEKDNIAGLRHLLGLCQRAKASFNFCSSVSSVVRHPDEDGPVPESEADHRWAQGMGYAQSKSVAEALCARAAEKAGIPVRVLRIGQIVADTVHGVWNATEAIPMMMQSALTIGALPKLQERPLWLPVDVVARGVVEISMSTAGSTFANVTNPRAFSWTEDLLPALREAGLEFEAVGPREWVRRLRESNPDPAANPPIKLVDFFASKYDRDDDKIAPSKQYHTENARSLSQALRDAPLLDRAFVSKFVNQFLSNAWKLRETPQSGASPPATSSSPPETTNSSETQKTMVVVSGNCGSGKTSLATSLASWLRVPYVEGDSLHSRAAVESMERGVALSDADRQPWLGRINRRVEEVLYELDYARVVVSCSALKRAYRDSLRGAGGGQKAAPAVVFLDLQCAPETLVSRVGGRENHYMKAEMVESQIASHEGVGSDETDIFPIDAESSKDGVVQEAKWFLQTFL